MKAYKTTPQQIEILKERGLSVRDRDKTEKYLLSNNYYNIINGYSKFFQYTDSDRYIEGSSFDDISTLYTFDKDIKRSILQALPSFLSLGI